MASLFDHTKKIRAAIQAAQDDGFEPSVELYYSWEGRVTGIDLELIQYSVNGEGTRYVANYEVLFSEEREDVV